MIDHPYTPHPVPGFTNRDQCEYRLKDEDGHGRGICAEPKRAHAVVSDLKPRDLGCQCHQEEGDSPCKVHGEEKVHYHPDEIPCGPKWKCFTAPPLFQKGPIEPDNPFEPRKRWPRKVGWTKLLARRKACSHTAAGEVALTFAREDCPRCLRDEVAYWKGRTHSAEGQRDVVLKGLKELVAEHPATANMGAVEKGRTCVCTAGNCRTGGRPSPAVRVCLKCGHGRCRRHLDLPTDEPCCGVAPAKAITS